MKLLLLDRDGVINVNSKDVNSPYYYILKKEDLILKEGVKEAFTKIKALNIPVYLITRQKCISKGLISAKGVFEINKYLESLIDFKFNMKLVEQKNDTKELLLIQIIEAANVAAEEIYFIDDSLNEVELAKKMGITAIHSDNLLEAVSILI